MHEPESDSAEEKTVWQWNANLWIENGIMIRYEWLRTVLLEHFACFFFFYFLMGCNWRSALLWWAQWAMQQVKKAAEGFVQRIKASGSPIKTPRRVLKLISMQLFQQTLVHAVLWRYIAWRACFFHGLTLRRGLSLGLWGNFQRLLPAITTPLLVRVALTNELERAFWKWSCQHHLSCNVPAPSLIGVPVKSC